MDTQITAVSPAGSGQVDITVTTPGGPSAINSADQFSYIDRPTIVSYTLIIIIKRALQIALWPFEHAW